MIVNLAYYLIFGLILFFIINYIKMKDKSVKNFLPIILIYIIIISGIIANKDINTNIFLVVVVEFFIRLISNLLSNDNDDNLRFIYEYVLYIVMSLIINNVFINKVDNIFLGGESLKIVVWILIILYLYQNIKIIDNPVIIEEKPIDNSKYREYIVTNYAKFKNLYNNEIDTDNSLLKNLLYAIMIYEDKKRNKYLRAIDNLFIGKINKLYKVGIMQVPSKIYLTDVESIKIVENKLIKIYNKYLIADELTMVNKILKDYYKDDLIVNNVTYIYNVINNFLSLR